MKGTLLKTVKSDDGKRDYEFRLGKDNVIYCSCRGWKFNGNCKHLKRFAADVSFGRRAA